MTTAYTGEHRLTPAQQDVTDQSWDARVLVTAGAGAGKTHTLVRRLDVLVEREELEAAEILVLSFSRAAVRELLDRIDRHASGARRVRAQTFDSWATALLVQAHPDRDWTAVPFDRRIEAATAAIAEGAVEATERGAPGHVVIDEVQDLVGVRREMVEELLDRFSDSCGFTVVGDAAQAVYGFQVSDPDERALETNYFFDWLRASYGEDLVEIHLGDNFRARTDEARTAEPFGASLKALPSEPSAAAALGEQIHGDLRARLLALPSFGALNDSFVQDSLRFFPGTTAILCRDNGQALLASELLSEGGVPHRLQRSAQDRPAPAWIADLLSATDAGTLSRERFGELVGTFVLPADAHPDRLWQSLRKVARGPRATLEIPLLRQALAAGRLPDELTAPAPSSLVVSTVHRAKGLEFDRVLIAEPAALVRPSEAARSTKRRDYDPAAEARLLYVAMTRPRDDLYRFMPPPTWHISKDQRLDRWYVGGRERWARNGIESTGLDVCKVYPPGTHGVLVDPPELQRFLRTELRGGEALELELLHQLPEAEGQTPPYAILSAGRPIGEVSERFRKDLHRLLKLNAGWEVKRWPGRITGLRLDCVEAVAGSSAATDRAGLGAGGAWLAPRLGGLGRFQWDSGPMDERQ